MWKKLKPYVYSVAIALAVGGLSALLTRSGMDAYKNNINKPPLDPPMILFPIVWTILFTLMGIGSALVYKNRSNDRSAAASALRVYAVQLAVNFLWSIIFFNMQAYLFAFVWLLLLWALIIVMIIRFARLSKTAAYLQIPYLLWVTFAGYLNLMIYFLN